MWWNQQSWLSLGQLDPQLPVIVPLGSCEQHGKHLPLFVDTMQVQAVAENLEARLGDKALVLPALWLGSSHHHKDFPGTITVRPSLYAEMIKDVARSILRAGFNRIFFLNGHGGNEAPAVLGLTDLIADDDIADAANIAFSCWWTVGKDAITDPGVGLEQQAIAHACEIETSLILALQPDLEHLDELGKTDPRFDNQWWHSERGGKVHMFHRFHRLSTDGHMGLPELATAEKGNRLMAALIDQLETFVTDFAQWPTLNASDSVSKALDK